MIRFSMILVGGRMSFRYYLHIAFGNITGEILNSVCAQPIGLSALVRRLVAFRGGVYTGTLFVCDVMLIVLPFLQYGIFPLTDTVLTHLRRMVLKINFRRLVKINLPKRK